MDSLVSAGLFLAAIALSEGLRILPPDTLVLRRLAFGPWQLGERADDSRRLRMVSWCIPLALPLVIPPGEPGSDTEMTAGRAARVKGIIAVLRLLGLVTLVALILGLPLLVARSGTWGLIVGVVAAFALSAAQAVLAAMALARLGLPRRRSLLLAGRYLWPFAAQRAAEDVQRAVVERMPPLLVLYELLPRADFARVVRPQLYDALRGGPVAAPVEALLSRMGVGAAREIVDGPPVQSDGSRYCPRCGASFYDVRAECSDCPDVPLRPVAGPVASDREHVGTRVEPVRGP